MEFLIDAELLDDFWAQSVGFGMHLSELHVSVGDGQLNVVFTLYHDTGQRWKSGTAYASRIHCGLVHRVYLFQDRGGPVYFCIESCLHCCVFLLNLCSVFSFSE